MAMAPVGEGKAWFEELRQACVEISTVATEVRVDAEGVKAAAAAIDHGAMQSLAGSAKTFFPLRFESLEDEVNFLAVLNLLDIGEDYRELLRAESGEGAHETVLRGMLGFSLSGKKLDAEGLSQMSAYSMEQALGVKSKVMQPLEGLPGEMEVDGPLAPLVKGLAAAARYIGKALKTRRKSTLGRLVLDTLEAQPASAEALVAELAETFPALMETHVYTAGVLSELAEGRSEPRLGDRVLITGLASRPDLNDKLGRLGQFDDDGGRWEVYIDSGKPVKVKPEKLRGVVEVALHGRAQALAVELWRRFGSELETARLFAFTDIERLTAQGSAPLVAALRHLGALVVDLPIAASIEAGQALGRSADCALRAVAVTACEAIAQALCAAGPGNVAVCLVDAYLWGVVAKREEARRVRRHRSSAPLVAAL